MSDKQWFLDQYDDYVEGEFSGAAVEKSRDSVAHEYLAAVESGSIDRYQSDLISEGRALFDRFVMPARDRRSNSLRKNIRYILDALSDDTILGLDDPMLRQAFPLGNGSDKTLLNWSAEDFAQMRTERYRVAAEVMKATRDLDTDVSELIDAMVGLDAQTVRGLFS